MKIFALLFFISSLAQASDVHFQCKLTSTFTQFFSETRGDRPGFYSSGLSSSTDVEYLQAIGSNDLQCLNCATARWSDLPSGTIENASPLKPGATKDYDFPKITLMTEDRVIVHLESRFLSQGSLHLRSQDFVVPVTNAQARVSVEQKLTDASAPEDSAVRVVNSNQAGLAIDCRSL